MVQNPATARGSRGRNMTSNPNLDMDYDPEIDSADMMSDNN